MRRKYLAKDLMRKVLYGHPLNPEEDKLAIEIFDSYIDGLPEKSLDKMNRKELLSYLWNEHGRIDGHWLQTIAYLPRIPLPHFAGEPNMKCDLKEIRHDFQIHQHDCETHSSVYVICEGLVVFEQVEYKK